MTQPKARNLSLDFVKGICVLAMILNHTSTDVNPLSDVSYEPILRTVGFVTWAFVFLAGFMVGWHYAFKFEVNKSQTALRLLGRAFKLVALVIIINLLLQVFKQGGHLDWNFLRSFVLLITDAALTGSGQQVSFEILFPIAYTLLFGIVVLNYIRFRKVLIIVVIVLIVLIDWVHLPLRHNIDLTLVGLAGVLVGNLIKVYPDFFGRRLKLGGWVAVGAWSLLIIDYTLLKIINIPDVPMFRPVYLWLYPLLTLFEMLIVLTCFYHLSLILVRSESIYKIFVLVGSYSLFSYFTQMLYIKVLNALELPLHGYVLFGVVVLLTFGGVVLACMITDLLRQKIPLINSAYRFVFG